MKLLRRAALAASAVVLASTALASPAFADLRTFRDAAGDTGSARDLTRVRVNNGADGGTRVRVAAHVGDLNLLDATTFWLDTAGLDAGPEYKVVVLPNTDGMALEVVDTFRDDGRRIRCRNLVARADAGGRDVVSISVPRLCMGGPGRVRVSVRTRFVSATPDIVDWAPRRQAFFGWVRR